MKEEGQVTELMKKMNEWRHTVAILTWEMNEWINEWVCTAAMLKLNLEEFMNEWMSVCKARKKEVKKKKKKFHVHRMCSWRSENTTKQQADLNSIFKKSTTAAMTSLPAEHNTCRCSSLERSQTVTCCLLPPCTVWSQGSPPTWRTDQIPSSSPIHPLPATWPSPSPWSSKLCTVRFPRVNHLTYCQNLQALEAGKVTEEEEAEGNRKQEQQPPPNIYFNTSSKSTNLNTELERSLSWNAHITYPALFSVLLWHISQPCYNSPDVILFGWLGSKHQLTNPAIISVLDWAQNTN